MPNKERFIPKLELDAPKGAALTNLRPFKVTIQRASRKTEGTELPYLTASDAPAEDCKVYFQIWEADTFEKKVTGEAANSSNEFLVEIPGYIKQTAEGAATYDFLVAAAPTLATGDTVGWITLKLKDAQGQPYGGENGFIVPIVGEAEDDLDLGVTLQEAAGTREHENKVWAHASCVHVCNLTHIVGSMLAEGGLSLNFWADMNDADMRADRADWSKAGYKPDRLDAAGKKLAKGERSGKYIADIINDAEFEVQGNAYTKKFHSLTVNKAGDLILGSTPWWEGKSQIVGMVQKIRDAVHQQFLKGKGEAPRLRRISLMAHGDKKGLWMARPHHWMGNKDCPAFAQALAPHCLDDVVITLFACLCGYGGASDVQFGEAPPAGGYLGEGSFGQALCQALKDAGLSRGAVWAHTIAGHTTTNPYLRAFVASTGDKPMAADVCFMTGSPPPADAKARRSAAAAFLKKADAKRDQIMHLSILHPGTPVQNCNGGVCSA